MAQQLHVGSKALGCLRARLPDSSPLPLPEAVLHLCQAHSCLPLCVRQRQADEGEVLIAALAQMSTDVDHDGSEAWLAYAGAETRLLEELTVHARTASRCCLGPPFLQNLVQFVAQSCRHPASALGGLSQHPVEVARELIAAIASTRREDAAQLGLPDSCHQQLQQRLADVQQLSRQQLRKEKVWRQRYQQDIIVLLGALEDEINDADGTCSNGAGSEARDDDAEHAVALAASMALLPCAFPLCSNLQGCSKGRVRGRRCSGCRVVRYCSVDCQRKDWGEHRQVCKQLVPMAVH